MEENPGIDNPNYILFDIFYSLKNISARLRDKICTKCKWKSLTSFYDRRIEFLNKTKNTIPPKTAEKDGELIIKIFSQVLMLLVEELEKRYGVVWLYNPKDYDKISEYRYLVNDAFLRLDIMIYWIQERAPKECGISKRTLSRRKEQKVVNDLTITETQSKSLLSLFTEMLEAYVKFLVEEYNMPWSYKCKSPKYKAILEAFPPRVTKKSKPPTKRR